MIWKNLLGDPMLKYTQHIFENKFSKYSFRIWLGQVLWGYKYVNKKKCLIWNMGCSIHKHLLFV